MLKVSCQAAVTRFDRPAVLQCLYRVLVLAHHRLDCDAHTRHQTRTAPGVAEVRDFGVLMQLLADTVADKAADDREAVLLDIGLYCVADIPYPVAAARHLDAAMQTLLRNIQQPLGFEVELAAPVGAGIVAIEAVDLAAGVDRNDVAGADLLLSGGDTMNDRVIHADARRGRKAVQVQEVGPGTVAHDKVIDDFVDLSGSDTGFDRFAASFQGCCADRAGLAHLLQLGSIFDLDHG